MIVFGHFALVWGPLGLILGQKTDAQCSIMKLTEVLTDTLDFVEDEVPQKSIFDNSYA